MHIHVSDVALIWFLVVVGAKPHDALVAKVGLDWVDGSDHYVESNVKLFLVDQEWVVDVLLKLIFVVVACFW